MVLTRCSVLASAVVCIAWGLSPGVVQLSNGVEMPQVSLGTAGYDNATVAKAVVLAANVGMTGVDTAFNYNNQAGVGKGLKQVNRSAVFVTTKTTDCYHHDISDEKACAEHTRTQVESDFKQLDVSYIDLLLLHGANHQQEGACDAQACSLDVVQWKVYEEYFKAGKVKFHVGMTADPEAIMSYCQKHGIVPMAYSPMGGGSVFTDPLTIGVGKAHGKTSAQVALKWIVDKGFALTTKSNSQKHLAEDLDLFAWNITEEETKQLDMSATSKDVPSWACTAAAQSHARIV